MPEILRAAMRDELQKVVSFPTEVILNEDVPIVDRLAAYELLAKYGIGQQRELKGEVQHTHGVIHLPPLATGAAEQRLGTNGTLGQPQLGSGAELTVEADEIEVTE